MRTYTQEETHRFAITYNRDSHRKNALRSALDDIPGVGPKRREALRKRFGSLKAIRAATAAELAEVIGGAAGEKAYLHFHGQAENTPAGDETSAK